MSKKQQEAAPQWSLKDDQGHRKYLTEAELEAFEDASQEHPRRDIRTFCLVMRYTGARISEGLELTPAQVDIGEKFITLRTMKQRQRRYVLDEETGQPKIDLETGRKVVEHLPDLKSYRRLPVPDYVIEALDLVHDLRKLQKHRTKKNQPIWGFGRTTAWHYIKQVMASAGVEGPHATPKGLRHGFGVLAASKTHHPRAVQKWLGHKSLETTTIYMDVRDDEERELARRTWRQK